jgi:hypothetical protein
MDIDLSGTYWERVRGFISENQIDARWKLRKVDDYRTYGSLRIVSHPDLKPGYLRSHLTIVTNINPKSDSEILKAIEDYQMEETELEVYSIDEDFKTINETYEAPFRELETMFDVKVFEK